ncbi:MAG TPA: adenosylmethionine--8-amino-7-oxononanoate transaminase [Euzebya sp.]|nr:adenosylmethionine--8-amino-7-oxononanoate transaminase [Euzebya sp.]
MAHQMTHDQLRRLDAAHVWHPFTQMDRWLADEQLVIDRAEGVWLVDADGRRYLDGNASLWVNIHGHGHPTLDAALHAQVDRLAHVTYLGLANTPATLLAQRLVELAPGRLSKVFFSEAGAAAVEVAVKMAYAYWLFREQPQRSLFVSVDGAYHGDTVGSVSVGHIDAFHATYAPLLFTTAALPQPYCYRCPLGLTHPSCQLACADALEDVLTREADRVAGVVVEPRVQGAAGIITAPDGHLRRIADIARAHGTLLIVDEVATGFGRTGPLFSCSAEGVEPDLMAIGKGLTAGYLPMSATMATPEIFDAFDGRTFFHGHSYSGNPLAAAVALANLAVFEQEDTLDRAATLAEHLATGLRRFHGHPHVGEVRQRGTMVGIELVADTATREPFEPQRRIGDLVCRAARDHGLVIRPLGDVIVVMPALAMTTAEADLLLERLWAGLTDVLGAP